MERLADPRQGNRYAADNPVNYTDPTGLDAGDCVEAAIGFVVASGGFLLAVLFPPAGAVVLTYGLAAVGFGLGTSAFLSGCQDCGNYL
jgi:hypothetical protein